MPPSRAEAALSASRLIDLERRRLPGRYDLAHLRAFHRCILGDVYAWAGQLRTVSIAKGSVFCLPQHLESYAADVFGRLADPQPDLPPRGRRFRQPRDVENAHHARLHDPPPTSTSRTDQESRSATVWPGLAFWWKAGLTPSP